MFVLYVVHCIMFIVTQVCLSFVHLCSKRITNLEPIACNCMDMPNLFAERFNSGIFRTEVRSTTTGPLRLDTVIKFAESLMIF